MIHRFAPCVILLCAVLALVFASGCRSSSSAQSSASEPTLLRAHSHNDYSQSHPLATALDLGYCSIEADVFLVDGQLLVAHDRKDCDPSRTLDAMYLTPLLERIRERGAIYRGLQPGNFILLVDIKADSENAYAALHQLLARNPGAYTRVERTPVGARNVTVGPITVIISGARPRDTMLAQSTRYAMYDGRLADLDRINSPDHYDTFMPLISDAWTSHFTWLGVGEFPADQQRKLRDLVQRAHARGHKLRFWGTGNLPAMYRLLRDEDVDLIGADNLPLLANTLREPAATSPAAPR